MASKDQPRRTLYIVLFILSVALAYFVGMHEERGRQNRKRAIQQHRAAPLRR